MVSDRIASPRAANGDRPLRLMAEEFFAICCRSARPKGSASGCVALRPLAVSDPHSRCLVIGSLDAPLDGWRIWSLKSALRGGDKVLREPLAEARKEPDDPDHIKAGRPVEVDIHEGDEA